VLVISYASVPSSPAIIQIPLTINDITNVGTLIIKVNICINSRTAISLFIFAPKEKLGRVLSFRHWCKKTIVGENPMDSTFRPAINSTI
jgi:hypothetical protein